ncbi:uncharacterized protein J4E88_002514 [Alternaria novae-zelandiae]|uniref:uncharacterized protein n=1 Tax=Alternaria novae-zelandiae TaxID=430562 RepID=UPI0020C38E9E|nr:uncharacterized protein J4E88_002514 [Alternaria novae-zelandiae]KAI4691037.1 hypothetical protein J4E88_002514 [Alternaria novae-zelandiae]
MSDNASSTFIGDNTHGSTLNQGSIITGDGSHVGNINHFHTATQEDAARKSCLKDLLAALGDDPDDYRQMLEDRKGPKTLGTCEWVSETDVYKSWISKSHGLLWISGDAGKGKTMLSLHLVSSLKGESSAARVVHFFCSRDHGRNNGASILRGLIYQLLSQYPSLFEHVLDDYDKHGASLFEDRKFQALWNIFARMLHDKNIIPITCLLDGLDECDEDGLEDFWVKIESLYKSEPQQKSERSSHSLKLLVVSRNHPYSIQQAMDTFPRLRLEPDNEQHVGSDISKFVDDRISTLQCPTEAREYIKNRLCDRSEGTYLWISFAINALKKVRVIDMERTVESFPRGLDAMYRRMLLAISEHERDKVMAILQWITTTFRPLSLVELATAVGTMPARGQTLEEAIKDEVAYAADLLTIATRVDKDNHEMVRTSVTLVHSSLLDFLQNVSEYDPDLRTFRLQAAATHDRLTRRLFDYQYQILQSFDSVQNDDVRFEDLNGLDRDFGDFDQDEEDIGQALAKWSGTPVHIAATIEQPEVMHILLSTFLREGGSINETDENGRTFLHLLATSHGSDLRHCWNVFSKFAESSEIVNHMLDRNGESALHIATRKSCLAINGSFQDDFYEDSDSDSEETVWNPVITLVETFGTAVNIQTSTGVTPLHIACKNGASSLVAYLLGKGANARLYDESGQNAMHWLCSQMQQGDENRPAILTALAESMTVEDIEAKRTDGQTARDLAVKHDADYLEIARRHANGLTPNLDMPAEPLPPGVREFCVSFWQSGQRCNMFRELHGLIDSLLNMVKCEPSSEAIAGLQRMVSEQPQFQHVLEKHRLYWESKAKE